MARAILDAAHIHRAIRDEIAARNADIARDAQQVVTQNDVVVVAMRQNPFRRHARRTLAAAHIPLRNLEYNRVVSAVWRRRTALKMTTGWPAFPMVFVKGVPVGGAGDVDPRVVSGELSRLLIAQASNTG